MWRPANALNEIPRAELPRVPTLLSVALWAALLGAIACGGDDPGRPVEAGSASGAGGESNQATGAESGGAAVEAGPPPTPPDGPMETLLSEYRDWQPRTGAPINVSSDIFALCRSPSLAENAFVDSEHGQSRMLMDWLNPAARAGFESLDDAGFAPGAAIVKEKLSYSAGGGPELVAIGLMLKHEPGFASENGDWEFAYWEAAPGLIDGPDQSAYCAGCHASSPTDFVFLDDSWRDLSEPE